MKLQSIQNKLMLAVAGLLIGIGFLLTAFMLNLFSKSLQASAIAHGDRLCQTLALEAANGILGSDSASLRKLLIRQQRITPSLAYMMIIAKDRVLAHTFSGNLPAELLQNNATQSTPKNVPHKFKRITTDQGKSYLDFELPVLPGRAEILRMGLLEKPYRHRTLRSWVQTGAFIAGILLLAIVVSFFLIRRITRPLYSLAEAVEHYEFGNLDFGAVPANRDEVSCLRAALNHMDELIEEYKQKLEKNTRKLDQAHRKTKIYFEIIRKIWEQDSLKDAFKYLFIKFQKIVPCNKFIFLVFDSNKETLYGFCDGEIKLFKREDFANTPSLVAGVEDITFLKKMALNTGLVSADSKAADHVTAFPIHYEKQLLGALLVPCPGGCKCDRQNMEIVDLILNHSSRAIQRAVSREEEMCDIRSYLEVTTEYCGIVGQDAKMQEIYKLIEDIAPTDTTILIQGKSGTGKELVAQAIHLKSLRSRKPFVVINCSAYPYTLLESELFGHEKGAFTGATRQTKGRFEQAHGGTVFLDEIGEIPASAQIKLLRILQTRKFERVGGEKTLSVDVRIVAATNKDLLEEVKQGKFREDLFYRLNVIPIHLPPLKDRPSDIPLQARYFLKRFAGEHGKDITELGPETMRQLSLYDWPGNVRELENCIEHAVVLARGSRIEVLDLPPALHKTVVRDLDNKRYRTIEESEAELLQETLRNSKWNKKLAAERLGISRNTLYRKLQKYQIASSNAQ